MAGAWPAAVRAAGRWAAIGLASTLLAISAATAQETPVSSAPAGLDQAPAWVSEPSFALPPDTARPTLVLAGLHLHEITDVRLGEQEFTAIVTLTQHWNDPRLRFEPFGGSNKLEFQEETAREVLNNIWSPAIMFYNAIGNNLVPNTLLTVYADGFVNLETQVTVRSSYEARFRSFPFDIQRFDVVLTIFGQRNDSFRLEPMWFTTWHDGAEIVPADYDIVDTTFSAGDIEFLEDTYSPAITFSIDVERRGGYYLWRHFLPLIGVIILMWTVFFITRTSFHDRLKIISIAFLTVITLLLWVNRDLPRVPYLTTIGIFYGLTAMMAVGAILESLMVNHYVQTDRMDRAFWLDRLSRYMFGVAFLFALAIVVFYAAYFR
ncbi:hypothetical protein [Bauldia sp.]|uniref:hypothetical protein n=1 Tax=Bauldia sp. TaxID=2575872 RepID=UPI003BABA1E1